MTQKQSAEVLGLDETAITKIERGTRTISALELHNLSLSYGVSSSAILGETHKEDIMPKLYGVLESDRSKDVVRDANQYINARLVLGDFEVESSLNDHGMYVFRVRNVTTGSVLCEQSGETIHQEGEAHNGNQ